MPICSARSNATRSTERRLPFIGWLPKPPPASGLRSPSKLRLILNRCYMDRLIRGKWRDWVISLALDLISLSNATSRAECALLCSKSLHVWSSTRTAVRKIPSVSSRGHPSTMQTLFCAFKIVIEEEARIEQRKVLRERRTSKTY